MIKKRKHSNRKLQKKDYSLMVNYTVLNCLIGGSNPLAYKIRNIYFFLILTNILMKTLIKNWPQCFYKLTNLRRKIINAKTIRFETNNPAEFKQLSIVFNNKEVKIPNKFITSEKSSLESLLKHNEVLYSEFPKESINKKMRRPDEFYFDMNKKTAFLIEKLPGKLPTNHFINLDTEKVAVYKKSITNASYKNKILKNIFGPNWTVYYVFCLSDYFRVGFDAEINHLETEKIPYFWGSDKNYQRLMLNFIKDRL